jgi:hypothetical protein
MEVATVTVDTTTLQSPWWVPSFNTARVRMVPNTPIALDIPVVTAGGFDGRIVFAGKFDPPSRSPQTALRVTLTNLQTHATHDVMAFADGMLQQEVLPPGDYEGTIDSTVLERLHAIAEPVRFTIRPAHITRNVRLVIRASPFVRAP